MLTSSLNATRFAQKPLYQPSYSFANVPKAERDLKGSCLQYVEGREDFHQVMAEMLLMCKEAMRRRPQTTGHGTSKPLSLEYLADRFDVDDPLFGYIVRTNEKLKGVKNNTSNWQKGMLQGFVTVTTFTNYQRTFQWDSHHPAAFSYDEEDLALERARGERKWDEDGSLAAGMQATVRCGDIWNEGIVWPRIAEISLLGGLGCGAALVKLVIEHLECMRASAKCNYDYVVLQATDNSISFYESMGFVRVGAIVKEEKVNEDSDDEEAVAEPLPSDSPEKPNAVATPCDIVTSPVTQYTTTKPGETPNDIAKKLNVNVWDVVFLNKDLYPDICPGSRLLAGTLLHVPVYEKPKRPPTPKKLSLRGAEQPVIPEYYVANEDDTPRFIAKKFNVNCHSLVEANKGRLEGLISSSRLKAGTRVKVSHLDIAEDEFKPYPHWSFPDDSFDDPEPSYMMAYKLDRKRGNNCRFRPVLESLAVPVTKYEPTELVLPPSPGPIDYDVSDPPPTPAEARAASKMSTSAKKDKRKSFPGAPQPPKRALCAYMMYAADLREERKDEIRNMSMAVANKFFGDMWRQLPDKQKGPYEVKARKAREKYFKEKSAYEKKLAAFKLDNPDYEGSLAAPSAASSVVSTTVASVNNGSSLYNKVVRLKEGAMTEGSEYTYWYVLTYIPDLKWCHLAPMIPCGKFGDEKPKSKGRIKYKLVDEKLGKEVDISSSFCIPIKARAMRKTLDADKEEWDVIDDGSDPDPVKKLSYTANAAVRRDSIPTHRTSAIKPAAVPKLAADRKRKRSSIDSVSSYSSSSTVSSNGSNLPPLLASKPKSKSDVYVHLTGTGIYDRNFAYPVVKRKQGRPKGSYGPKRMVLEAAGGHEEVVIEIVRSRGRPKGSKNKPKTPDSNVASLASPGSSPNKLNKQQNAEPQSSLRRANRDNSTGEPKQKRVRLSSPLVRPSRNGGEQKENSQPKPDGAGKRLRRSDLKPESIDFLATAMITTTTHPREAKSQPKSKMVSSARLLSSSSPKRSPVRSSPGPLHKRLRHRSTPDQRFAAARPRRTSAPTSLRESPLSPATRNPKRLSPRLAQQSASPILLASRKSPSLASKSRGRQQKASKSDERPKRKAAPTFLGDDLPSPRKRRRMN